MTISYGNKTPSLIRNGDFEEGTNANFTNVGTIYSADKFRGNYSLYVTGNRTTVESTEYVEVDTSATYYMTVTAKTLVRGSSNSLGSGHIGFSCYDSSKRFIDLRNCGDIGNTTLSRNLTAGDTYAYITSNSGWAPATDLAYFRHVLFFPASHPEYNKPHRYTRIGFGDYSITYNEITLMPEGDYRLRLSDINGVNNVVFPNIGYATPAGTPVSRGVAGGTFNYAMGNPNYPETWTTYQTSMFTGESRTSGVPFRYATKYIRFLHLRNYNAADATPWAQYLFDDILFIKRPSQSNLDFTVTKFWL